jgi:PAS domain S-box-containing protein
MLGPHATLDTLIAALALATSLILAYVALRLRRKLALATAVVPTTSGLQRINEGEAAEAVRRWAAVFRHGSWGVAIADAEGARILAANPALEQMHRYAPGEMVGMLLADTLAPDVRAAFQEQASELPVDDHVLYETTECRKDGTEFPVLIDAITVRDDDGVIQYRIATYLDLTQRYAAELARDQAEARFRTVQDASPDSFILLDLILDGAGAMTDAIIVYANAAACRQMNRLEGSLTGQMLGELFPGAAEAGRWALYAEVYYTGRTQWLTFHHETIGKWLRIIVVKIADGVCIISTDVSELKAAEAVLRRSHDELEELVAARTLELEMAREAADAGSRAKSEFLSRASHELRTPLNAVIGFSGTLLKNRGGTLGPTELKYVERIGHNGRHLLALVNDLLDLSKIEAGKMDVELSSVSLYDLVHDVRDTLESRAAERGLVLTVETAGAAPSGASLTIVTDAQRLRQVLINLVGNAVKYTEQGSVTVRIISTERGEPLRIDVIDTGPGIAPERIERMFEPFVMGEVPTAAGDSTGLGLSIARSLCTAMGYRLTATSIIGEGSTFSIYLGTNRSSGEWRESLRTPDPRRKLAPASPPTTRRDD